MHVARNNRVEDRLVQRLDERAAGFEAVHPDHLGLARRQAGEGDPHAFADAQPLHAGKAQAVARKVEDLRCKPHDRAPVLHAHHKRAALGLALLLGTLLGHLGGHANSGNGRTRMIYIHNDYDSFNSIEMMTSGGFPRYPPGMDLVLHTYWRSSAAWRVRTALALKGLPWEAAPHDLRTNEQTAPDYVARNPQGLVPALEVEGAVLTQSLAIIEYLDERFPEPPLLPADPLERARVRAFALAIACDIHPVQNLRVLRMLRARGLDQAVVDAWAREVIEGGLEACSRLIADRSGPFCFGEMITMADITLIPQLANARRFGARTDYPRLEAIEAAALAHPAFASARPAAQVDADPA